jgi:hypothetical protein
MKKRIFLKNSLKIQVEAKKQTVLVESYYAHQKQILHSKDQKYCAYQ